MGMKLLKEIYPYILGIIGCLIVFQFASTGKFIGAFVNRFSPCEQNPMNSFPCFAVYDIIAMVIAVTLGAVFAAIVLYKTIMFLKSRSKRF